MTSMQAMVDEIIARGDPRPSKSQIGTGPMAEVFYNACVFGPVENIVQMLYGGHVSVNDTFQHNWSGLQHAVFNAKVGPTKMLLALGADPNFRYDKDALDVVTAGACSLWNESDGLLECVKLVVEAGGKVNSKAQGVTPLIHAVKRGHENMARFLIESGADVNEPDDEDLRTPINWAAFKNNKAMVDLLLEKGADPAIRNKHNETAFLTARNKGHAEIAMLLAPPLVVNITRVRNDKLAPYVGTNDGRGSPSPSTSWDGVEMDERLKDFLIESGLGQFIWNFANGQITYEAFPGLTEEDLMDLGISRREDIRRILSFTGPPRMEIDIRYESRQRDSQSLGSEGSDEGSSEGSEAAHGPQIHFTLPMGRLDSKTWNKVQKLVLFTSSVATLGILLTLFTRK